MGERAVRAAGKLTRVFPAFVRLQLAHEKEMLQQRSRARMQKWGNTHEALQEKELKEMKAKFDVEEAARVVLDKEAEKLANAGTLTTGTSLSRALVD